MSGHAIRLRGFWTATEVEPGRVRFSRPFGRPGTLDATETAWLVGTAPGAGRVLLNGEPVGPIAAGEAFVFDVTLRLLPRNRIEIEVPTGSEPPDDIVLEIRTRLVSSPLVGEG